MFTGFVVFQYSYYFRLSRDITGSGNIMEICLMQVIDYLPCSMTENVSTVRCMSNNIMRFERTGWVWGDRAVRGGARWGGRGLIDGATRTDSLHSLPPWDKQGQKTRSLSFALRRFNPSRLYLNKEKFLLEPNFHELKYSFFNAVTAQQFRLSGAGETVPQFGLLICCKAYKSVERKETEYCKDVKRKVEKYLDY